MAASKSPTYIAIIVIALAAVLLSLVAGCVGGAVAGYLAAGARVRALSLLPPQWETPTLPRRLPETPTPLPEQSAPWPRFWQTGALVRYVEPGTPAAEAGLKPGDIITAVDDKVVDEEHPLDQVLRAYQPGDRAEIRWIRLGEERSARVRLGSHPDEPSRAYLGVRATMITVPFFGRGD